LGYNIRMLCHSEIDEVYDEFGEELGAEVLSNGICSWVSAKGVDEYHVAFIGSDGVLNMYGEYAEDAFPICLAFDIVPEEILEENITVSRRISSDGENIDCEKISVESSKLKVGDFFRMNIIGSFFTYYTIVGKKDNCVSLFSREPIEDVNGRVLGVQYDCSGKFLDYRLASCWQDERVQKGISRLESALDDIKERKVYAKRLV